MLDGAVFPGGVHPLEDQEHGPAIVSIEPFLERHKPLETSVEPAARFPLVREWSRVGGIVGAQLDLFAGKNAKAIGIQDQRASSHGVPLSVASRMNGRRPRRTRLCNVPRGSETKLLAVSAVSRSLTRTAPSPATT